VRIAIKSKDGRLVPDMGVRVGFLSGVAPSRAAAPATATLVPAEAVRADGTIGVVFVYAGDRVERRTVRLGPEVSGQRQVLSGLRVGERVVLSPSPSLGDGDAVRLAES